VRLKNHLGGIFDEAAYNVFYGLEDYWYARNLLRRVGEEERSRFSELGWAYGDPSYVYGTDPVEVFRFQANAVAKTLFGEALSCDLLSFVSDEEELYAFLADLHDEEGLLAAGPFEELPEGALYGDAGVILAEFTGEPETIWRLKWALKASGLQGPVLHYDPESERGSGHERGSHFLLVYDTEAYPERETIHHELFESLIRAWEVMKGGPGGR
jgi:hypothetical protein